MTERIALVELDLDRCSNTYGVSPCTAVLGVTGSNKCFNCLATCQDTPNYNSEEVTVTYSYASGDLPRNIDAIPNISSINIRPAKLELGESIGIRASVDIAFQDSRSPDTGPDGDRYLSERNYDPYTRGTYWGKFRARFPFTKGSNIRVLRGTNDQTKAQMEVRHFIVDKVAGPTSSGQFTIVCKDALKLVDGKQAQAPKISNGSVSADFLAGATSFILSPTGEINNYPASGLINIGGKEICSYTKGAGDVINITRAQFNTEAVEHSLGERVQLCLQYSGVRVTDILNDLLQTYSNVDSSYIPLTDWHNEDDEFIDRLYSAVIAEPTAAKDLINELLQQTASALWWDDSARLMRFRVLRAVDDNAAKYDDNVIMGGSFSAVDQPDKRVSQVWTYYGQINPLEKLDEKKNYSNSLATLASESESNYGEPSIKSIFSRWIAQDNRDAAERLNLLILSRYSTPPRLFSFGLQRDQFGSLTAPELGGGYRIENWTVQDETGGAVEVPIQSIQVRTSDTGYSVMAEEVLYSETIAPADPNVKNVYVDTNQNNYNLYTAASSIYTINSGDTVNVFISSGVFIGSTSTSTHAFTTGSGWPAGVTINIFNSGYILGKGGSGGRGGLGFDGPFAPAPAPNGESGSNGGPSMEFTLNCTLENNGTIGGGGGGGGGSKGDYDDQFGDSVSLGGSGGGAGAGLTVSSGGSAGEVIAGVDRSAVGNTGGPSSALTQGTGGTGKFLSSDGLETNDLTTVKAGDGGALGSPGSNPAPGGGTAVGGTAGAAVNKNGNTVTITNNGTIAGNIV
jgi:hypothetical protein